MTENEMTQLTDGDRVVVRYTHREVPGTVTDAPTSGIVGVILDAGLGFNGPGREVYFNAAEILRRANKGEGLVRIGDAFYRQADTIFAEEDGL